MRYALILIAGVAIGWFARQATFEKPTSGRSDRRAERPRQPHPERDAPPATPGQPPHAPGADATQPDPGAAPEDGEKAPKEEKDTLAEMVRSQSAAWTAFATMQAKQKVDKAFRDLGLDPETEKRIEDAIIKEAERQAERAILMMLGEEDLDPSAFASFMGLPPDLSLELERELATFLNDDEIQAVRERVQQGHKQQMRDMADMQINMMQIRDLSDDQRTRLREIYVGKDYMTEQFTQFAKVTRDRSKLNKLLEGEGLAEVMEAQFEPQRRRVRDILNDQQFELYREYEKRMVKQAEFGLKMMAGMLKSSTTKTPDAK